MFWKVAMSKRNLLLMALLLTLVLTGCAAPASEVEQAPAGVQATTLPAVEETTQTEPDPVGEATTEVAADAPAAASVEDTPLRAPEEIDWMDMPVIPEISHNAIDTYQHGLEMGNDPRVFSVLGECQSELAWEANGVTVLGYLSGFEDPANYNLGDEYAYLQATIDQFMPSWTLQRVAAHRGTNVAQVLSPLYSDAELCDVRETPLQCEFRRNNPSIVLISFETWFYDRPIETYETYMRQIIDASLEEGVLPVLVTGADSHADSRALNAALARLAVEYDIPLWNFWASVQDLPNHGLEPEPDENGFKHITYAPNNFDDPEAMQAAWPMRNLGGLQILDAIWRATAES
jgi:hypothetical protein